MNLPGMKKKSKERLRIDENDSFRLVKTELLNVNGMYKLGVIRNLNWTCVKSFYNFLLERIKYQFIPLPHSR